MYCLILMEILLGVMYLLRTRYADIISEHETSKGSDDGTYHHLFGELSRGVDIAAAILNRCDCWCH